MSDLRSPFGNQAHSRKARQFQSAKVDKIRINKNTTSKICRIQEAQALSNHASENSQKNICRMPEMSESQLKLIILRSKTAAKIEIKKRGRPNIDISLGLAAKMHNNQEILVK